MGNTLKDIEEGCLIDISDEILEKIKTYKEKQMGKKYEWKEDWTALCYYGLYTRSSHYKVEGTPGLNTFAEALSAGSRNFFIKCYKCSSKYLIKGCPKCDNKNELSFEILERLSCKRCYVDIYNWVCPRCERRNPLKRTVYMLSEKSFCFIATAVYGSYSAPNVMVLREFRDAVLETNFFGKVFIKFYYLISPPIADFIAQNKSLKKWVRVMLIEPIVKWLRRY